MRDFAAMSNASVHTLSSLRHELAGCSDELWEMKPLVKRPSQDELCLPSFRDLPSGDDERVCRARWRAIRELVDRWYGIAMPDAGNHDSAVARAEERVGATLPYSLRECVAFARDLTAHGKLIDITRDGLSVHRLGDDVSFCTIIEGNADWVVDPSDLGLADPPVFAVLTEEDGTTRREPTTPWASTVSAFVLEHVVTYLRRPAGLLGASIRDLDPTLHALGMDLPVHARIEDRHVFEGPGIIVLVAPAQEGAWAEVRVHSRATADHVPASVHQLRRPAFAYGGLFC